MKFLLLFIGVAFCMEAENVRLKQANTALRLALQSFERSAEESVAKSSCLSGCQNLKVERAACEKRCREYEMEEPEDYMVKQDAKYTPTGEKALANMQCPVDFYKRLYDQTMCYDEEAAVGFFGIGYAVDGFFDYVIQPALGVVVTTTDSFLDATGLDDVVHMVTHGKRLFNPDGSYNNELATHAFNNIVRTVDAVFDRTGLDNIVHAITGGARWYDPDTGKWNPLLEENFNKAKAIMEFAYYGPDYDWLLTQSKTLVDSIRGGLKSMGRIFQDEVSAINEGWDIVYDCLTMKRSITDPDTKRAVEDYFNRHAMKAIEKIRYRLGLVDTQGANGEQIGTVMIGASAEIEFIAGASAGVMAAVSLPFPGTDVVELGGYWSVGLDFGLQAGGGASFPICFSWNEKPSGIPGFGMTVSTGFSYGPVGFGVDIAWALNTDANEWKLNTICIMWQPGAKFEFAIQASYTGEIFPTAKFRIREPTLPELDISRDVQSAIEDGWEKCADEGEECKCYGAVRFGGKDTSASFEREIWNVMNKYEGEAKSTGISCTRDKFGKGLEGVTSPYCECQSFVETFGGTCAEEWSTCSCSTGIVRIGAEGKWSQWMKAPSTKFTCSYEVLGDPNPGKVKTCQCGKENRPLLSTLREPEFSLLKNGGCASSEWIKLGFPKTLEEAQKLMLANPTCAQNKGLLFYSGYSYSWGAYCAPPNKYDACAPDNNSNWSTYTLTKNSKCKSGWTPFGSHCYQRQTSGLYYDDAQASCYRKGGYLAVPNTQYENTFLSNTMNPSSESYTWLGFDFDNNAQWEDGTYSSQSDSWRVLYDVHDAADRGNGEPVTFMRQNGDWSFDSKAYSYQYICERSMHGRRECYEEWHDNGQCQGESNYYSTYKHDLSECISGNDIYGDDGTEPWYYTPTSRCHDSECTDCEEFTSMPSGKNECTPCSFEDNCSFMEVECRQDDPVLNCPLYKTYEQLPRDWCQQIGEWGICGVADGTVSGSGYGCKFQRGKHGYCKVLNSGDQCNTFQDPCGCGTGKFCNFDSGNTGGCESCSNHANKNNCYNDGLPTKGAEDCANKCFGPCPSGWELTFPGHPDGECQQEPTNDGETRVYDAQTMEACAEACASDSTCIAFDFHSQSKKCFKNIRCDIQDQGDGYLSCKRNQIDPCGCGTGKFCNFDYGNTGGCESCSNHANKNDCYNDGLPTKGAEDCANKCFGTQ